MCIRDSVWAGHVTHRWEQRVLNERTQQHVGAELRGRLPDAFEQRVLWDDRIADLVGAVLNANRLSAAIEMEERHRIGLRRDLGRISAGFECDARIGGQASRLSGAFKLTSEDCCSQAIGGSN